MVTEDDPFVGGHKILPVFAPHGWRDSRVRNGENLCHKPSRVETPRKRKDAQRSDDDPQGAHLLASGKGHKSQATQPHKRYQYPHATIDSKDLKTGRVWAMMGEFQKIFHLWNGSSQQMEISC
jgi:hypothetical protein